MSTSQVAVLAVEAVEASDTALDLDPQATVVRAPHAGWLTPRDAAEQYQAPPLPIGATWTSWARHHAYIVVDAALGGDEHPPDTARSAARQVVITQHPIGRDGWKGAPITSIFTVALTKIARCWRLDDLVAT